MDLFDAVSPEKAESQIDAFINARSKAKEKANAEEALYAESVRRFNQNRQREYARDWYDYHDRQLAAHEATFGALVAHHTAERDRYARMLGFGVGAGDGPPEAA